MIIDLTFLDSIALAVFIIYIGGIVGGIWLLWSASGRMKILGWVILVESVIAAALLAFMSSKYWIGREGEAIDVKLFSDFYTIMYMYIPLALGGAILFAVGIAWTRWMQRGKSVLGTLLICTFIPLLAIISTQLLVSLTRKQAPVLPDPARDILIAPGFEISIFATKPADRPTSIIFGPDRAMYIANENGDIWGISMEDGSSWKYASGFVVPVGLAWREDSLFVASRGKITALRDTDGDRIADNEKVILSDLPAGLHPWHGNNGIVFGEDDRLYFPVGASTDAGVETYPLAASILSVNPDGSDLQVYASGLRNSYRLALNGFGDMFATDNGPGTLDVTPPDELNHIVKGADYGFPKQFGLALPGSGTVSPVALFPPHASANGIVFYQADQFPSEYFDNAFVTLWTLGQIYRVQLTKGADGNYHSLTSIFVSGLKNPVDITTGPDGSLYAIDYGNNVIYKISYKAKP